MDQTLIFKNYITNKELVFQNLPKIEDFSVTMETGVWLNVFIMFLLGKTNSMLERKQLDY